jgi:hypothetical protein
MSKTKKQKMELLYRICKALSPLYGELEDEKLRGQISVMLGAQIFYVRCPSESFQKISMEGKKELAALQAAGLSKAKALQKLTKEHQAMYFQEHKHIILHYQIYHLIVRSYKIQYLIE